VGKRYRTAGRLTVRVRQRLVIQRGAKVQVDRQARQTYWKQTNREHRYKYIRDNGEDGRHLKEGGDNHKDR
jgi:hypothetical protein